MPKDKAQAIPVGVNAERPGVIDGKLIVSTNWPGEERIEIPVYAHVVQE